jgi:hypothetical protein
LGCCSLWLTYRPPWRAPAQLIIKVGGACNKRPLILLAWLVGIRKLIQAYPSLSKIIQDYPRLSKIIQDYPRLSKIIQDHPSLSQAKPGQARAGQARPSQARPGQARPGQARPGQARPGQAQHNTFLDRRVTRRYTPGTSQLPAKPHKQSTYSLVWDFDKICLKHQSTTYIHIE